LHRWRISLIKATPAKFIGFVHAPDEKSALEMAAEDYSISENVRDRLVAIRED
jgi:1,2-phenylacetyl-CoA epoxidase PaaB subunit